MRADDFRSELFVSQMTAQPNPSNPEEHAVRTIAYKATAAPRTAAATAPKNATPCTAAAPVCTGPPPPEVWLAVGVAVMLRVLLFVGAGGDPVPVPEIPVEMGPLPMILQYADEGLKGLQRAPWVGSPVLSLQFPGWSVPSSQRRMMFVKSPAQ